MKKKIVIFNIVMFVLILIADYFYMQDWSLIPKSIGSGLFVLQAIGNFVYILKNNKPIKFAIWQIVALAVAMLGDIFLNINFIVGGIIFAIGHVLFFIAYCQISKIHWKDLIYGFVIFAISLLIILFLPILNFYNNSYLVLCLSYAFIISFMVGKAFSNLLSKKSKITLFIFIGSVLFFISDFSLLLSSFGNVRNAVYLCLITYYPAQSLLANSIYFSEN